MPSSNTITAFHSFTALTQIKSAEVNTNFSNYRGHIIPVDPSTATAGATMTYDLGGETHLWRGLYNQYQVMYLNTAGSAPAAPAANHYAMYFKSDGELYKKTSAGVESAVAPASAAGSSYVHVSVGNGWGSTATKIRRFTTTDTTTGSDITFSDTSTVGSIFTINTDGLYSIFYCDLANAGTAIAISHNSSALTTNGEDLTYAQGKRSVASVNSTVTMIPVQTILKCVAGDIIRAHGNGAGLANSSNRTMMQITRLA